eukprot:scaffold22560_cov135-Cylindrotheca_fusiformis.AAC.65
MAQNPLLDSTLALQNVRSFGTEGREKTEEATAFVAPQDTVHPYLLFRGCDIKDLHVHEEKPKAPEETPKASASSAEKEKPAQPKPAPAGSKKNSKDSPQQQKSRQQADQSTGGGRGTGNNRRPKKPNPAHQVGTGASLLHRKARGTVDSGPETPQEEFDFQSKLAEFTKEDSDDNEEDDAGDAHDAPKSYEKDDFFDSISCDALDKQQGLDKRLRGAEERNLNTETFGAVALNSQRRRRRGGGRGGRGRGRGGRGGRGRGRGRGRNNSRWGFTDSNGAQPQAATT